MQSIPGPAHFAFHNYAMHAIARALMHPHADRETELLATLRETYFPEAQHGEQESPERRYASKVACHITAARTACIIVIIIDVAIQSISLFAC